jgi:hypothetical protein
MEANAAVGVTPHGIGKFSALRGVVIAAQREPSEPA